MNAQEQIKVAHTLLTQKRIVGDAKEALVSRFTNGRTTSVGAMTGEERDSLINHLRVISEDYSNWGRFEINNQNHRYILSLCHQLGWETEDGKVDLTHLGKWLAKYGYLHKPLKAYTSKELPRLVVQMENVLKTKVS